MSLISLLILALVQGAAELLPVSSSAHVIVAERLMGLDPSSPEMTFLLVMLHTGTMFAVLFYFWPKWKASLSGQVPGAESAKIFLNRLIIATVCTGVVGLGLKKIIEKLILAPLVGGDKAEIEQLFKNLPLIAAALLSVGILILISASRDKSENKAALSTPKAVVIGIVQGLCLPFRGFSRSGATISTALLNGISRQQAEEFSFALAVLLTPPVVGLELLRLIKASGGISHLSSLGSLLMPGLLGMVLSFGSGFVALKILSAWLEQGKWKYFGIYCILASIGVYGAHLAGV